MSDNPILKAAYEANQADEPTFDAYRRLIAEWKERGGPKPTLKWAMGIGAFIKFEEPADASQSPKPDGGITAEWRKPDKPEES